MNIKLTLQYDGTDYAGWQKQINSLAVQNVLEQALKELYGSPIHTIASGRTDKGVHAQEQIVSYHVEKNTIPTGKLPVILNGFLPEDIRIKESFEVSDNFHPRYGARVRVYRYTLLNKKNMFPASLLHNRYVYYPGLALDIKKIKAYLFYLTGRYDFTSFCSIHDLSSTKHREIFRINVTPENDLIYLDFYGNGFLRGMVRSIIGNLLFAYKRKLPLSYLKDLLERKDPLIARSRAPAKGLVLKKVYYTMLFGDRDYYPEWTK